MANESLSSAVSDRICNHMNKDHRDALIIYARHYAGISNPNNPKMVEINPQAMTLEVNGKLVAIPFDHVLAGSEDAHCTLVSMIKEASKPKN